MAHPYGGADNFPASIELGDDGVDAPSFTTFNTPDEGNADRNAYNFKRVRSLNWQQSILPTLSAASSGPYGTLACVGYDTLSQKWLVAGQATTGGIVLDTVSYGYGDQTGWTAYPVTPGSLETGGAARSLLRGNEPAVSSKYIYKSYVPDVGGHVEIARIDTTGPTTTHQTSPAGSATDGVDCALATMSGVVIAAVSAGSAAHSNVYYSTDHAVTWTAQTALTLSVAVGFWCLATNAAATQVLAIPSITGSGGGPSYLSSPDGVTWASQPGLVGVMGASEVPTTLCWGDDGTGTGCWILSTFDTTTHLYRSTDGVNWINFSHDLPSGLILDEMVNISDSRILVALVDETPLARVIYSLNGGQHWSSCRVEANIVSTVSSVPTHHKLVAGPNQAAIACGGVLLLSMAIGDPGGVGAV